MRFYTGSVGFRKGRGEERLGEPESWTLLCYKPSLLRCIMLTATTTAATGSAPPALHYLLCHLRLCLDRGEGSCKHAWLILLCVLFCRVCPQRGKHPYGFEARHRPEKPCWPKVLQLRLMMKVSQPGFFLVKELNLSYHKKETTLFTIDPCYDSLNSSKFLCKNPAHAS